VQKHEQELKDAREELRAASRESERLQAVLADAMCHYLPELRHTHKKAVELLEQIDYGMLPVRGSTDLYKFGDRIIGGTHEVRIAWEPTAERKVVLKKYVTLFCCIASTNQRTC